VAWRFCTKGTEGTVKTEPLGQVCYHEGKGVEKDDERAIQLWTKAANQVGVVAYVTCGCVDVYVDLC
jgi:hypothetical protein